VPTAKTWYGPCLPAASVAAGNAWRPFPEHGFGRPTPPGLYREHIANHPFWRGVPKQGRSPHTPNAHPSSRGCAAQSQQRVTDAACQILRSKLDHMPHTRPFNLLELRGKPWARCADATSSSGSGASAMSRACRYRAPGVSNRRVIGVSRAAMAARRSECGYPIVRYS